MSSMATRAQTRTLRRVPWIPRPRLQPDGTRALLRCQACVTLFTSEWLLQPAAFFLVFLFLLSSYPNPDKDTQAHLTSVQVFT